MLALADKIVIEGMPEVAIAQLGDVVAEWPYYFLGTRKALIDISADETIAVYQMKTGDGGQGLVYIFSTYDLEKQEQIVITSLDSEALQTLASYNLPAIMRTKARFDHAQQYHPQELEMVPGKTSAVKRTIAVGNFYEHYNTTVTPFKSTKYAAETYDSFIKEHVRNVDLLADFKIKVFYANGVQTGKRFLLTLKNYQDAENSGVEVAAYDGDVAVDPYFLAKEAYHLLNDETA